MLPDRVCPAATQPFDKAHANCPRQISKQLVERWVGEVIMDEDWDKLSGCEYAAMKELAADFLWEMLTQPFSLAWAQQARHNVIDVPFVMSLTAWF